MKVQLLVHGGDGAPLPLGPREMDRLPERDDMLSAEFGGKEHRLRVMSVQLFPVIPGCTFKHDEAWVICQLL